METMKTMKGFKVTDSEMSCNGYQYRMGEDFVCEGEIMLCERGFHFCSQVVDCFVYKAFDPKNRVFEIEAWGKIIKSEDKFVANHIRFIREIPWNDVLNMVNSGSWNSGFRNSGDWNSGFNNSGDWNSGFSNSGNANSGNWNSGNRNSGYLNTDTPKRRIFNKETDVDLDNIRFPRWMFFDLIVWVDSEDMSDAEKEAHPGYKTTGGYLKTLDYKEAAQMSYNRASKKDQDAIELLPNYDADILYEIFGIDRREKPQEQND